jgi:hypothetical protein
LATRGETSVHPLRTVFAIKEVRTAMSQNANGNPRKWNGVKVFAATMAQEREKLGEKVTAWIRQYPQNEVVDTVVTQSSDEAFHCLAITVFYYEREAASI